MSKFTKFKELSWEEQLLFFEALFLQLYIGLLLKIIRFKLIPRFFSSSKRGTRNQEQEKLIRIKTAIQRSNQVSPWKNKCLVSSLAARRMLNRRMIHSQLSLGVAKGPGDKTIAHAWLKVGDFEIVEKVGGFSELYLF